MPIMSVATILRSLTSCVFSSCRICFTLERGHQALYRWANQPKGTEFGWQSSRHHISGLDPYTNKRGTTTPCASCAGSLSISIEPPSARTRHVRGWICIVCVWDSFLGILCHCRDSSSVFGISAESDEPKGSEISF